MMITVYEIKDNGYYGVSKEIDPAEGAGKNWVYDEPPTPVCQWINEKWVERDKEPLPFNGGIDYDAQIQSIKQQADQLLSATDWTAIPSVADPLQSNPYLMNQEQFIAWRSQVRFIAVNTTLDAVFPPQPKEVWSN